MPVTICRPATNSVALPSVYSQFTCGILRKKIAAHTLRQSNRSSSQSPSLVVILASPNEQDAIFNFRFEAVERAWRWSGNNASVFAKDAIVAGTEEFLLLCDPTHPTTQVGADVGYSSIVLPVLAKHKG